MIIVCCGGFNFNKRFIKVAKGPLCQSDASTHNYKLPEAIYSQGIYIYIQYIYITQT